MLLLESRIGHCYMSHWKWRFWAIVLKCLHVRIKRTFTPDPAKPASFRLEMYRIGLYGKLPSRGFILTLIQVQNNRITKVHETLKTTINYFAPLCWNTTTWTKASSHSRSGNNGTFITWNVQFGSFWKTAITWIYPKIHFRSKIIE